MSKSIRRSFNRSNRKSLRRTSRKSLRRTSRKSLRRTSRKSLRTSRKRSRKIKGGSSFQRSNTVKYEAEAYQTEPKTKLGRGETLGQKNRRKQKEAAHSTYAKYKEERGSKGISELSSIAARDKRAPVRERK